MLRLLLFFGTNIAVLLVASVTLRLLGLDNYLNAHGLNFNAMLIFAAIIGFGGAFVSLFLSKFMAKAGTGMTMIEQPSTAEERWLLETVSDLARQAGIGMPEVGIFPANQSNAFATGWSRNNALVAVSSGMLERFDRDSVRAVLGHEIGHIANGDMVTLTLIQGVLNTFVIFLSRIIGLVVDRAIFRNEEGRGIGFFVVEIAAQIVLGILASIIVAWFSRYREYRADASGARLAGAGAMISALQHLKRETEMPDEMPESFKAFAISEGKGFSLAEMFASHPPLDDRIEALRSRRYAS